MPHLSAIEAEEGYRLLRLCILRKGTVILAVSGGRDSMALLALAGFHRARFEKEGVHFAVASVDHGLRPESAQEARHVARAAERFGLPHRTLRWDGSGSASNLSARARNGRYALLLRAARERGSALILTAHHEDDQIETHLMAAARGDGTGRRAGMRVLRALAPGVELARPLLRIRRERLEGTLSRHGIGWIDDPTNTDPSYARARLRAELATGFDRQKILAAIDSAAQWRDGLEAALVDLLVQNTPVRIDSSGRLFVSRSSFARVRNDVACELLARAVTATGGAEHPPRRARVERLAEHLRGEGAISATLGGARVRAEEARIVLAREFGRLGPPDLVLSEASERLFDRRFEIPASVRGARIGAFGHLGRGNEVEATLPVLFDESGSVLARHPALLRKLPAGMPVLAVRQRIGWRLLADLSIDEGVLTGCGQIAANPPEPVGNIDPDHYFPRGGQGVGSTRGPQARPDLGAIQDGS